LQKVTVVCRYFAGVGERTREGNDLLREMIEAGIMKYGDAFKHSMEEGGWDLDKVDMEGLKDSKLPSCSDK
jgi:F-type H+/Na+-transporting ATPase subunit beta